MASNVTGRPVDYRTGPNIYDVLDRLEQVFFNQVAEKHRVEEQQKGQLLTSLLSIEMENQHRDRTYLLDEGVKLNPEFQTDDISSLISNINTRKMSYNQAVESLIGSASERSQYYRRARTDYNRGVQIAGDLRSQGYATSPGEAGTVAEIMFSPEEQQYAIQHALDSGQITQEDAINSAFTSGFSMKEDEALNTLQLRNESRKLKLELDQALRSEDENIIVHAQSSLMNVSADAGKLVSDRFIMNGIGNIGFFEGMTDLSAADFEQRDAMLADVRNKVTKEYPAIASDIMRAFGMFSAPGEDDLGKYSGLVEFGYQQYLVLDKMSNYELKALSDEKLKRQLNLQLDAKGQLTEASINSLARYSKNQERSGGLDEYYILVDKYRDYIKGNMVFDQATLQEFVNLKNYDSQLGYKRIESLNKTLPLPYDASYGDITHLTSSGFGKEEMDKVDEITKRFEAGIYNATQPSDSLESGGPFDLDMLPIDPNLQQIVDQEDMVEDAMILYKDSLNKIRRNSGIPFENVVRPTDTLSFPTPGYIASGKDPRAIGEYVPNEEGMLAIRDAIADRINRLREVGGKKEGLFGGALKTRQTERDVMNNEQTIQKLILDYEDFLRNWASLTGARAELFDLKESMGGSSTGMTPALDQTLNLLEQEATILE